MGYENLSEHWRRLKTVCRYGSFEELWRPPLTSGLQAVCYTEWHIHQKWRKILLQQPLLTLTGSLTCNRSVLNVHQGISTEVVTAPQGSTVWEWWMCIRHGTQVMQVGSCVKKHYFHQHSYITVYRVYSCPGSSLSSTWLGLWAKRLWQERRKLQLHFGVIST